jgi:hypothetical protein
LNLKELRKDVEEKLKETKRRKKQETLHKTKRDVESGKDEK